MAIDRRDVEARMKERGFTTYATMGGTKIQFVSEHMYDVTYKDRVPPRQQMPVINVIVNTVEGEFECVYNLANSVNVLRSPVCGSVMNNDHFDRIVTRFESEAKWLSRLTG